jgi:hypothetical protein
LVARKEFEAAKGILRDLITKNPAWVYPRIILSHVLLQEGQDETAAERVLREIVELDPSQAESWRNLAVLYRHQGRLAQSAAVCRSARVHCTREMGDLIGAETCLLGVVSGEVSGQWSVARSRGASGVFKPGTTWPWSTQPAGDLPKRKGNGMKSWPTAPTTPPPERAWKSSIAGPNVSRFDALP